MRPIPPPTTPLTDVDHELRATGFAVLASEDLARLAGGDRAGLDRLRASWDDLPIDAHLRDGGRYRRRRHGCFVVHGESVAAHPPRAHWQPLDYNALHGGFERWFEPLAPSMVAEPAFARLLVSLGERASALRGARPWFVEVHPFRIETTGGIGRPTPEGAHRDGVDLVALILIARQGVRGGETRVFDADGPRGTRFVLGEPWTTLLLDDARVVHETTPIQPLQPEPGEPGEPGGPSKEAHRDTLVITFRAEGFQAPGGSDPGCSETGRLRVAALGSP